MKNTDGGEEKEEEERGAKADRFRELALTGDEEKKREGQAAKEEPPPAEDGRILVGSVKMQRKEPESEGVQDGPGSAGEAFEKRAGVLDPLTPGGLEEDSEENDETGKEEKF